jgi:hypothetical protein
MCCDEGGLTKAQEPVVGECLVAVAVLQLELDLDSRGPRSASCTNEAEQPCARITQCIAHLMKLSPVDVCHFPHFTTPGIMITQVIESRYTVEYDVLVAFLSSMFGSATYEIVVRRCFPQQRNERC